MKFYLNRAQFHKETRKELDGNNYLVAYDVPIAKTGIQKYSRGELGDRDGHPDELVNVYRARDVFEDNEDLIESFDGIPIVYEHPDNGRVDNNNFKHFSVGTVSGVYYKDGSLYAKKLTIIDKEAIENVLNKRTHELSIGFKGKVTKKAGTFKGERYDYREDVIHANHLALCESGKAGPYYAINSKKKGKNSMIFSANSVTDEHEKMKDCLNMDKNVTEAEPPFDLGGIIQQEVKSKMSKVKPFLMNEEEEEEEYKEKKKHMKDKKSMKNDDEVDMEDESHEDEEEESKEEDDGEVEEKEKKSKARKMVAKRKEGLEDFENDEEEVDKKDKALDKELLNALRKSNEKLRSIVNSKNKAIKSLELKNVSLERALDESKEYMTEMANRLKQKNLTNSMSGPDNFQPSPIDVRMENFGRSVTSAFLFPTRK